MLSYGCSPSCVNGVADGAALNFSAEFMQTVIDLSLADETHDEMTARAIWATAFTRLNTAAHAFRATPSWEPPHILAMLIKMDAIEQPVKADGGGSNSSGCQPALGEELDADTSSGAVAQSSSEERRCAGSSNGSPRLEPGPSSAHHSSQTAPHPRTPHSSSGTPEDADGTGRASLAPLPMGEGAMKAVSTGGSPRIAEPVLLRPPPNDQQVAEESSASPALNSPPLFLRSDDEQSASPSVPAESRSPVPKPVACDPADSREASVTPPPSSTTAIPPVKIEKRVHWDPAPEYREESDGESSLTSLDDTTADERDYAETESDKESEDEVEIEIAAAVPVKAGQSKSKVAKGKAPALAAKPKRRMAPVVQMVQKRMPERTPHEFTSSCVIMIVLNCSATGASQTSVSRRGQPTKQTPPTPSQVPRKRRATELQAPRARQTQRHGSLPLDGLKELLEGIVPQAVKDAREDKVSDDESFEEIAPMQPPTNSERQTPRKLHELSHPYDEFDAATGCFIKVPKVFGFRYRTEVTPYK